MLLRWICVFNSPRRHPDETKTTKVSWGRQRAEGRFWVMGFALRKRAERLFFCFMAVVSKKDIPFLVLLVMAAGEGGWVVSGE